MDEQGASAVGLSAYHKVLRSGASWSCEMVGQWCVVSTRALNNLRRERPLPSSASTAPVLRSRPINAVPAGKTSAADRRVVGVGREVGEVDGCSITIWCLLSSRFATQRTPATIATTD